MTELGGSLFASLDTAINWEAIFQEEATSLAESITINGPGDERLRKLENLMQMAEHQTSFLTMQQLALTGLAACQHSHNDLGTFDSNGDPENKAQNLSELSHHDPKKCAACKAGRRCTKT